MNDEPRFLVPAVVFVALVVAVVGSLGAPLITAVADQYDVSLAASQWTLTIPLLSGAVATPVLGRLGSGPHRRAVVLTTLGIVVLGSALTVVPLPFAVLLIGRAAQGTGLGLTALTMATATDHLGERRAASTIALLSVASTAGIGVGYPLAGALTDAAGIRAAYGLGLVVTALAFVAAFVVLPQAPPRPGRRVDIPGAALLTVGLLALLVVISQTQLWRDHPTWSAAILAAALLLLVLWAFVETRVAHPLVDIRLLRHPAVAGANLVIFTGGIGMYLLLSLITRYVQTPAATGYGFDLNTFEAGLILVPFSVAGFAAGKFLPRLRLSPRSRLAASATTVLVAFVLFALTRSHLAGPVVAMTVLGLGVGAFFASMPAVILAVTPKSETASAMSVNQVVRSIGFSIGSALTGIVLAAQTTDRFPAEPAYATAAWTGAAITAATIVLTLGVLRRS
ncbi:MFS transporter [Kribbella sp. NBC_00889]|uniref:MFS transporter n=1 Tax=Kribbella sp. NBC_00889 TaxID=2975974 RepID=UPI003869C667|nr:MFS transporter [Kribbella sp. NBC_00889]